MTDFHDLLAAVHIEIWDGGTDARPELLAMLAELDEAPLPNGVTRLPSSSLAPGPHLAAQDEGYDFDSRVVWLEAGRLARARSLRFAAI